MVCGLSFFVRHKGSFDSLCGNRPFRIRVPEDCGGRAACVGVALLVVLSDVLFSLRGRSPLWIGTRKFSLVFCCLLAPKSKCFRISSLPQIFCRGGAWSIIILLSRATSADPRTFAVPPDPARSVACTESFYLIYKALRRGKPGQLFPGGTARAAQADVEGASMLRIPAGLFLLVAGPKPILVDHEVCRQSRSAGSCFMEVSTRCCDRDTAVASGV